MALASADERKAALQEPGRLGVEIPSHHLFTENINQGRKSW